MAATRAAELTVAYKTLTDAALRAEYDASSPTAPAGDAARRRARSRAPTRRAARAVAAGRGRSTPTPGRRPPGSGHASNASAPAAM